jgi:hypothetical protein
VALVQAVAGMFQIRGTDLDLRRGDALVDGQPALSHQGDGHGREAVVVAGDAARFRGEARVGALQ